nr:hypothetical protein BaRGS_031435 [Batillaria attramentaria]
MVPVLKKNGTVGICTDYKQLNKAVKRESSSKAEHEKHLSTTTQKLRDAGFKLNRDKCTFEKEEVEFLGYLISATDAYLERIRQESKKDPCMQIAMDYTKSGWPEYKQDVMLGAQHLYPLRAELSMWNELLVIPFS